MRIFVLFYIFLFLSSPALAYVEEDNTGLAEMTAGEQNTNMYKLNSRTDYLVKRLKKIDEYSARKGGGSFNVADIEDVSLLEQKDLEERQNKKILEELVKMSADSKKLKNDIKPEVYISLLSFNGVKDARVAADLQKQLSGGKR